ncbi:MAG: SLBB domain-containing protein, partial [Bacteroidaceae bacterium]|nr:SLBB domain-containing protein [Bacteroidaceae bacterium]
MKLEGGDVIRIKNSNRPMENYVAIRGDVYYGGNFDYEKNNSLLGLLEKVQPRYTARKDYVFVERTRPDQTVEILTVPFPDDSSEDFQLQAKDVIRVLSLTSFRDVDQISVNGQVRAPFTRTFGLNDRMTVNQAIELANGLKPSVYPVAYIFRRDITNPAKMEYLRINLETDGDTELQPGDRLNIYDNTTYTNVGEVRVSGAVKNPFGTEYDASLTVHDMLAMAGGLLDDADPYARLFRTYNNRGNIGLDLRKVKSNKGSLKADPILMEGDVINIVRLENTVSIRETGTRMAQYVPDEYASTQKTIVYQGGHNAAWYVRHYAGGFVKTADKNSVTVTFPNNQTESTKRGFLWIRRYPKVEPGGVVTLRIDEEKREKIEKPKEKIDWGNEF